MGCGLVDSGTAPKSPKQAKTNNKDQNLKIKARSRKDNMNSKKINKFLFPVMLVLIPLAAVAYGTLVAKNALADYVYNTYSAPFLANGVIATHKKAITIQKSLIEYSVLKVVSGGQTAAKR